ncbi:MAG: ATP-binding cassette domain-containing protein [Pirellulales bacterium]
MPQVTIRDLTLRYRGPSLLDQVSCRIEKGERIGLLGRNGVGKTTLMRLIAGLERPDSGTIEFEAGTKVAWLSQDVPSELCGPVAQVVLAGFDERSAGDEAEWVRTRALDRTLQQMQLDGEALFETLSTGLKRRVLLAKALIGNPDLLLLDEPTNHLDIDSITWLETFLSGVSCTFLFVTHDRAFLTRLATRILEIDRGKLFDWACDYQTFLKRKEAFLEAEEKQQALFDKRLAEEEVWIRTGIKARRTRNEGRVRALEAMRRERQARRQQVGQVQLQIDAGAKSGMLVAEIQDASFGYDEKPILQKVTTTIFRGDKVGILGPNGAGKSTLLKGILGELPLLAGNRRLGTNLQVAYFDQNRAQLDPTKTAEENVGEGRTTITIQGKSRHIIGYLQDFLFTPEEARTPIRYFSGGQKNRLLLAKLFTLPANLLVLDEPTNDLDSETLELLESNLVEYEGTVLVVSHDRDFLNNVVSSTLVLEGDRVKEYDGGYDDWLRQRTPSTKESSKSTPPAKAKAPSQEAAPRPTSKKRSFKEQKEYDELPDRITLLESQLTDLHALMADASFYKQPSDTIASKQKEAASLEQSIANAYARWEELEAKE